MNVHHYESNIKKVSPYKTSLQKSAGSLGNPEASLKGSQDSHISLESEAPE